MTDETQVSAPPVVNPLLERARMPGSTFTLPSQGLFYKDGELDESVVGGEIYIYPMVTLDELLFKTPDKLYSGEAIVDVFSRCVPGVRKPLKLLAKDVDFIMTCLRKITYGDIMEITYKHDCEDAKNHDYKISMTSFINAAKRIDPTTVASNYTLKLDNGQVVLLVPPRFENVLRIYQSASNDETEIDILKRDLLDTIAGMIQSVDGITDRQQIQEWVESIPAGWVHKIGDSIEKVSNWGPVFDTVVECQDCKKETTVSTPVNPLAFFI